MCLCTLFYGVCLLPVVALCLLCHVHSVPLLTVQGVRDMSKLLLERCSHIDKLEKNGIGYLPQIETIKKVCHF